MSRPLIRFCFLFKIVFASIVLVNISCGSQVTDKLPVTKNLIPDSTFDLHFDLPFESSNYYNDTNFILHDAFGKQCLAAMDTVTKGGGHIDYENLPAGLYTYTTKTVFNEIISDTIELNKNSRVSLEPTSIYNECRDGISIDTINVADSIILIYETEGGYETLYFRKDKKRFRVKYSPKTLRFNDGYNVKQPLTIQSFSRSTTITGHDNLVRQVAQLQALKIGFDKMEIHEEPMIAPSDQTIFYMRANRNIFISYECDSSYFLTAWTAFKKSVVR